MRLVTEGKIFFLLSKIRKCHECGGISVSDGTAFSCYIQWSFESLPITLSPIYYLLLSPIHLPLLSLTICVSSSITLLLLQLFLADSVSYIYDSPFSYFFLASFSVTLSCLFNVFSCSLLISWLIPGFIQISASFQEVFPWFFLFFITFLLSSLMYFCIRLILL